MRYRAELPGVVLAAVLTGTAVLALLIALGIRGAGPLTLGLGEADGAARLQGGEVTATLGEPGGAASAVTPVLLPGRGVAAPVAAAGPRRLATEPAGTQGRQRTSRGGVRTPARRAPTATPAPTASAPTTSTTTTPRPVATPNPVAVKVRGRGKTTPKVAVPKRRVGTPTPATSAEVPLTPVPPPAAPELERRAAPTPVPTPAGVGADDGVLKRVPGASPAP